MKIVGLIEKESGCDYHRIFLPLEIMKRDNPDLDILVTDQLREEILEGTDIVFVNRYFKHNTLEEVLKLRDQFKFKLVVDNDDYWNLDPHHILYPDYIREGIPELILKTAEAADYATVTHERLGTAIKQINPNIKVLPNSIPNYDQFNIESVPGGKVRLFWSGSNFHLKDIEILRNPITKLNSDSYLREKIAMVMGGYSEGFEDWGEMISAYTHSRKLTNFLLPYKPVREYYGLYMVADVALIPLRNTLFNSYKSNLKILEAANMGIPVIVSKVDPYLDFPEDIVCYIEKQTDWNKWIRRLVSDEKERKERGHFLKEYCSEVFNFEKINKERLNLFAQLSGNNIYLYEDDGRAKEVRRESETAV